VPLEREQRDIDTNELFRRARNGDSSAEAALFEKLSVRFRYFARHRIGDVEDAKEVAQEALLAVSRDYGSLSLSSNFVAWANQVIKVRILGFYRRDGIRKEKLEQLRRRSQDYGSRPQPDPALIDSLRKCLAEIFRRHDRYARILNLHYQGYAVDEICGRLKISRDNFYVILHRARVLLEACLERRDTLR